MGGIAFIAEPRPPGFRPAPERRLCKCLSGEGTLPRPGRFRPMRSAAGVDVQAVLDREDSLGQRLRRVAVLHGDAALGQHSPVVELLVDEVYRRAGDAIAGGQDGLVDGEAVEAAAAEPGQKGRMHVDDAVAEVGYGLRGRAPSCNRRARLGPRRAAPVCRRSRGRGHRRRDGSPCSRGSGECPRPRPLRSAMERELLLMTTLGSASSRPSRQASMTACMLLPRARRGSQGPAAGPGIYSTIFPVAIKPVRL